VERVMYFKRSRIRDLQYLRCVAQIMPCIITGIQNETVVGHHLLDLEDKGLRGGSMKAPDDCILPICYEQHMALHAMGDEKKFFEQHGVYNAEAIARELYRYYNMKDTSSMWRLIISKGIL